MTAALLLTAFTGPVLTLIGTSPPDQYRPLLPHQLLRSTPGHDATDSLTSTENVYQNTHVETSNPLPSHTIDESRCRSPRQDDGHAHSHGSDSRPQVPARNNRRLGETFRGSDATAPEGLAHRPPDPLAQPTLRAIDVGTGGHDADQAPTRSITDRGGPQHPTHAGDHVEISARAHRYHLCMPVDAPLGPANPRNTRAPLHMR